MKVTLKLTDSLEKNASRYFEEAKKYRQKAERAASHKKKHTAKPTTTRRTPTPRPLKEWYDKFRWFLSSEGILCVGGRDATTNEILIKKHVDPTDVVFHAQMSGSPFFVVKAAHPNTATRKEAAQATLTFSQAWKKQIGSGEVYHIAPSQVSKHAESGEYLTKGSFVIRGKRTIVDVSVDLAVGLLEDGRVMAAPVNAVQAHAVAYLVVHQGKRKPSAIAKLLSRRFSVHPDDVLRVLPGGGFAEPTSKDWIDKRKTFKTPSHLYR